jgi:hypothetical protein
VEALRGLTKDDVVEFYRVSPHAPPTGGCRAVLAPKPFGPFSGLGCAAKRLSAGQGEWGRRSICMRRHRCLSAGPRAHSHCTL